MVFNSLTFLVFFAIVWGLHQLPLPWTVKKFNLLVASYLFYAAWNPPFVLLLVLSTVVDFVLARWLGRLERAGPRRLLLLVNLVLNLGLLGYFKYGKFLLENWVVVAGWFGVRYQPPALNIILPLGISFYTFETISYVMDVYRRRIKPTESLLDYALFLTFFPHLVAGPIVRARDFLPQCLAPRRPSSRQLGWGFALLVLGLFEKVILADALLTPVADQVFGNAPTATFVDAWVGTLAFSGQIFFDFAGYSTCAIGVALTLGFVLNDNFHFPYGACGFADFWHRWHMSLSSWLRDYLYIPLGGSRHGRARTYVNLMLTMLLGGLWHGASWRFLAWGGLHGAFLAGERAVRGRWSDRAWANGYVVRIGGVLITFTLVSAAWVFFRAADFSTAFELLSRMARPSWDYGVTYGYQVKAVVGIMALVVACQWLLRDSSIEAVADRMPWWLRGVALMAMLVCLALAPGDSNAFIYFQF